MKNKLIYLVLIFGTFQILFTALFAQTPNKTELVVQNGCFSYIGDLSFSPDGKTLAVTCRNEIKILDAETGKELKTYGANSTGLDSPVFSPDGKTVAAGWNNVKLWNVADGKSKEFNSDSGSHERIVFSENGKLIASISETDSGFVINVWNVETGKLLKTIEANDVVNLNFHKNNLVEVAYGGVVTIRNTDNWEIVGTIQTNQTNQNASEETIANYNFSPNGLYLAVITGTKTITIWNTETGKEVRKIGDLPADIKFIKFNDDGDELIIISENKISRRDVSTGNKKSETLLKEKKDFAIISIDPAIKNLVYEKIPNQDDSFEESFLTVRNIDSGVDKFTYQRFYKPLRGFEFSHNENFLVSDTGDISGARFGNILLWDLTDKLLPRRLNEKPVRINGTKFSPDDRFVGALNSSDEGNENIWSLTIWDVFTKNKVFETSFGSDLPDGFDFTNNGEYVVTSQDKGKTIKLWSIESGKEIVDNKIRAEQLTENKLSALKTESDGNFYDRKIKLTQFPGLEVSYSGQGVKFIRNGKAVAHLMPLKETDWAVFTPEGLFDASAEGKKLLHYVVGLEPITLEQMKGVYYVPGLLQKIFKNEPLPKVALFSENDLFPKVEFSAPKTGAKNLTLKITNRGGGIGQVQVLVNGKEIKSDVRPNNFDAKTRETSLDVDITNAPFFSDKENKIEVIAKNASGSLTNRGTPESFAIFPPVAKTRSGVMFSNSDEKRQAETPDIYIIAGGVSNYTNQNLNLNFAAKDAENFAKTIELGAISLLGDKTKVHIRLLSSNAANTTVKFDAPDAKITTATKADFLAAFADFKDASPNDVFIIYLAGHGVSLNLSDNPNQTVGDTYLYLTQEATAIDKSVLSVKQSREAMTISGDELKDLMKTNKAVKRLVLILDTCAAGALSNSLVAKRDLPSDQIKALETLKDNTGFYVLMGASADAVSYEASQFGQGLLTYSLLQAMKGAKLRDGNFAYVADLFGYAQERVPQMAKNIGGIQRPILITPETSNDFPIGKFTADEQKMINLANPKPVILRPSLQNKEQDYDDLDFTADLKKKLREENYVAVRGGETSLVFIEADEMVDAIKPSGSYIVNGDEITLTLRLIRNKTPFETLTVNGKLSERENLIKAIVARIIELSKP